MMAAIRFGMDMSFLVAGLGLSLAGHIVCPASIASQEIALDMQEHRMHTDRHCALKHCHCPSVGICSRQSNAFACVCLSEVFEMAALRTRFPQRSRTHQPAEPLAHPPSLVDMAVDPPNVAQRTQADPSLLSPTDILYLQRTIGNASVARLVTDDQTTRPRTPIVKSNLTAVPTQQAKLAPIQRKLNWQNPNWSKARHLDASSGGGGGVLFVGEDKLMEVVVKPGEESSIEGAMAAMLINESTEGGGFDLKAPGLRVVTAAESASIKTALTPLLGQAGSRDTDDSRKAFKQARAQTLLAQLDQPGTVVQDLAGGREFAAETKRVQKHTKKSMFGKREFRKESPLRVFKHPGACWLWAKRVPLISLPATRIACLACTIQRISSSHPPRFDSSTISGWELVPANSWIQKWKDEGGKKFTVTADEGMATWKKDNRAKALAANNYKEICDIAWESITDSAARGQRKEDEQGFRTIMNAKYKERFYKYFGKGLVEGKQQLIASIDRTIQNPDRLAGLVPGAKQEDVQKVISTMQARKAFLQGG
ncbi:MAG: hypothetical protein HC802_16020 [Caldilineaceae bacterium]|nr:hypothetical protein [Caldilineaceae bacterium]